MSGGLRLEPAPAILRDRQPSVLICAILFQTSAFPPNCLPNLRLKTSSEGCLGELVRIIGLLAEGAARRSHFWLSLFIIL